MKQNPFPVTIEGVVAAFAFDDMDRSRERLALRMRVGPAKDHCDVSFGELLDLAAGAAAAFIAKGCKPGDRVALLMPHSKRLIASFFGARLAHLVPSIIAWPTAKMDREKYERNLRGVLANLNANWLVSEPAMSALLGHSLGQTTVLDASIVDARSATQPLLRTVAHDETAFIQFSGGTTGTQKSVPISFRHLAAQLAAYAGVLELNERDHFVSWLPLYHDMGLLTCLLLPFVTRLPVTIFSPMEWVMDPRPFLQSIGADRSTLCWLPNFAFSFLANRRFISAPESIDLSSLRCVINCSEPVRAASMDAFRDRFAPCGLRPDAMHTCYAMAEATFAATQTTRTDPPRRYEASIQALGNGTLSPEPGAQKTLISCGASIPGIAIRIVDDAGRDCGAGAIGEVWLQGESIMDDYLASPHYDPGRKAFTDGWFRTGDLGALLDDHLYVTGRKKDVIMVGGVNVYPEDIEATVGEVPGVHPGRVVALGLLHEDLGTEQLVVVAELNSSPGLETIDAIRAEIRTSVMIAAGLVPQWVFLVPPQWVVKSTAGKISRVETRSRVLQQWDELVTRSKKPARTGG